MGAIAGVLSGIGGEMQRENINREQWRQQANEEMAQQLENLSKTARNPEFAANLQQAAFQYRTLRPGQKPPKELELHNLMYKQVQNDAQQQQQSQPGQGSNAQPQPGQSQPGGAPNTTPGIPAPPQQMAPSSAQPSQPVDPSSSETPPQGVDPSQMPAWWQQLHANQGPGGMPAPPQPTPEQVQQTIAAAPPPVSGMSSPGFSTGAPSAGLTPPPSLPPGTFRDSKGNLQQSAYYTPLELAQIQTQNEITKAGGIAHAQMGPKIEEARQTAAAKGQAELALYDEKMRQTQDFIARMTKQNPGQHWIVDTTATGIPTAKQDHGTSLPGYVNGSELPPDVQVTDKSQPDGDKWYKVIRYTDGTTMAYPQNAIVRTATYTDPQSGRTFKVGLDRGDKPVPGTQIETVNPSLLQTQTKGTQALNVNGQIVQVPTIKTQGKVLPGKTAPAKTLAPPPGQAATPAVGSTTPAPATPPAAQLPRGSKVLGNSAAEQARLEQNPLATWAQEDIRNTDVALSLVDRVQKELATQKDSKLPFSTLIPALAYKFGYGTDTNRLISDLSMGSIIEGGRLAHPTGSRAISILDKAMVHTPNPTSDSISTMKTKLAAIKDQLNDYKAITQEEGKKFPGLKRAGDMGGMTPPPASTRPPLASFQK